MRRPETIRTARLLLRSPQVEDVHAVFDNWATDAEVTRYLTWRPHTNVDTTSAWLQALDAGSRHGADRSWLICSGSGAEPFGMLSLRLSGFKAELGYVLARAYWGYGFMPEAVCAIVDCGFSAGLYRVAAYCDIANVQSARVLQKVGMAYEGVLRRYALHPNVSPEPRDVHLYAACR